MFYIYSPSGQVFSGTLEKLRKVESASSTAKGEVRQEFMLNPEVEASYQFSQDDANTADTKSGSDNPYAASKRSLQHYKQVLRSEGQREPVYHVYQIMSHPVVTVQPEYSIDRVFNIFEKYKFKLLPVVQQGRLWSAMSREQLYRLMLENQREDLTKMTVGSLIEQKHQQVLSVDPVSDVRRAASVLLDHRLEALPVVEESGEIQGIVSRSDILKCLVRDPPLSTWA
jgi:predicted transcriptional regulator